MACIATVKGYSDIHNWGNQPNQASEPVQLEADRFYFLQVIHKEDGGPDHMSVAWSGPGIPAPVIIPATALFIPPSILPEEKNNPQPKRTERFFDYLPAEETSSICRRENRYFP